MKPSHLDTRASISDERKRDFEFRPAEALGLRLDSNPSERDEITALSRSAKELIQGERQYISLTEHSRDEMINMAQNQDFKRANN